jgi:hypothetical protein
LSIFVFHEDFFPLFYIYSSSQGYHVHPDLKDIGFRKSALLLRPVWKRQLSMKLPEAEPHISPY